MNPPGVSDLSNRELNLLASSGVRGGTLTGAPGAAGGPFPGGGLVVDGRGGGGFAAIWIPSNRGKGPAIKKNDID